MSGSRARAAGLGQPPKRFVVMYGGLSLLSDNNENLVVPEAEGLGYDLKRAALALGVGALPSNPGVGGSAFDVTDHVSIVSGLTLPWADAAGNVPAGGRSRHFHYNTIGPQLSGVRGPAEGGEKATGPTADQVAAATIAGDTPQPSLSLRVQAANYGHAVSGDAGRISYRIDGSGNLVGIEPIVSPAVLHGTLFGNFVPPDPAEAEAFARRAARHRSIVDLVRTRAEALHGRLGASDRRTFEAHLDEVRRLEQALDEAPPPSADACMRPDEPDPDPEIGSEYSGEDLRAGLLCDYVRMAFACDLTRVAAIRLTHAGSSMECGELVGHAGDMHSSIGHGGRQEAQADCLGWHIKHFARLVAALRDTPESDGSSLLHHTALVLLFEGGWGYDAELGTTGLNPHSTENMIALVGGHAGGLNAGGGRHVVKAGVHPACSLISALTAVGAVEGEQLGEVTGAIAELFA